MEADEEIATIETDKVGYNTPTRAYVMLRSPL